MSHIISISHFLSHWRSTRCKKSNVEFNHLKSSLRSRFASRIEILVFQMVTICYQDDHEVIGPGQVRMPNSGRKSIGVAKHGETKMNRISSRRLLTNLGWCGEAHGPKRYAVYVQSLLFLVTALWPISRIVCVSWPGCGRLGSEHRKWFSWLPQQSRMFSNRCFLLLRRGLRHAVAAQTLRQSAVVGLYLTIIFRLLLLFFSFRLPPLFELLQLLCDELFEPALVRT